MTKTRHLVSYLTPGLAVLLLILGSCQLAFAGKGNGKGKGGGGSQEDNNYAAKFTIDNSSEMHLLGDGGSYIDQADGVEAYFHGTGNPTLRLQESMRVVTLNLSHCKALIQDDATDALLDAATENDPMLLQPNLTIYGGMTTADGKLVDPAFFGLDGRSGYSDLAIGFEDPNGYPWHWEIRFDPDFGGDQAMIAELDSVTWQVSTYKRTAVLLRKAAKGRPHLERAAICDAEAAPSNPLNIRYVVTCDIDGDDNCDLR